MSNAMSELLSSADLTATEATMVAFGAFFLVAAVFRQEDNLGVFAAIAGVLALLVGGSVI